MPGTSSVLGEKDVRKSLATVKGVGECRLATALPEHPRGS